MDVGLNISVEEFFADFDRRGNDSSAVTDFFDDQFLSMDPKGSTVVRPEQLAAVLPARAAMFQAIGVTGTKLADLRLDDLDDNHVLVHTRWEAAFEEPGADALMLSSTYLLRRTDRGWRVAVYLNHANIAEVIARGEGGDRPR